MILVDISSIFHRMIFSSVKLANPPKENEQFVTSEFVNLTKHMILDELINIEREHKLKYGEMVICLDSSKNGYWRKDVHVGYKSKRKAAREKSEINFGEVFEHINDLTDQLIQNIPWKVVALDRAEADDIILVLSREFNEFENILIHSPDKDMLQAQRDTTSVYQYSSLTRKWLVPETKNDNMDDWILEHVCLGDVADEVPKVVDHTEFSVNFLKYLSDTGIQETTPFGFRNSDVSDNIKVSLIQNYDIFKTDRKGVSTGEKDIYKKIPFGPAALKKALTKYGSLDNWLDSHPLYRKHYDRNFTLVMEEGIPKNIWDNILVQFSTAKTDYNNTEFVQYLGENHLRALALELPNVFKLNRDLTAADFGW